MADLKIFGLNCSLKASKTDATSSTDVLMRQLFDALGEHGASGEFVRAADFAIKPGVTSDEGDGDDWPALRKRVLDADIFVLGSPVWMGQPSSIAKRVLERMDAFLGETDDKGRMPSFGKIAVCVTVGNEDGAHHVSADVLQALFDVGFTIPANGVTYWVGEAMGSIDYKDLKKTPDKVAQVNAMLASNAAHLARLLKAANYPGVEKE
ncbi:MAG: NAD(P)H-dependent oxidoreductase [Pseudolabrys sp.]|nr:NAD(P)H-dependent oxidoreductase [Pseudolabrys sp.]